MGPYFGSVLEKAASALAPSQHCFGCRWWVSVVGCRVGSPPSSLAREVSEVLCH